MMTPEELSTNEDLNQFYRTLIAFQATALAYVSDGEGTEGRIARAIEVTGMLYNAKAPMLKQGCNCSPDQVCCNDGSCAYPGFC